ncbi:hypothetical protein L6164_021327 [Bauhinia variegata]|uniref:Uncharacterized protein n=1 Tax=Bauhinia variegata TaxID=167791 RepID=A0ACB9MXZ7_BAUVA|nr:hypothetical protein L6164_021327 [Bauhinia variegata]
MADSQEGSGDSRSFGIFVIIMMTIIAIIFLVVVFIFFLHLYANWCRRRAERTATGSRHRNRLVFAAGQDPQGQRRGLDPEILRSLPVLIFQQDEFKDGLECAVCLSELVEGEKARLLPKCNHGFHVDCIDIWFQSHSTCPICRNPAVSESSKCSTSSGVEENASENGNQSSNSAVNSSTSTNFPTNVSSNGNQTRASSVGASLEEKLPSFQPPCSSSSSAGTSGNRGHGMLTIDIPSEINSSSSLSPASRFAADEQISPMMTSLKSFKRLLSWNRRSSPCSPGSIDVEQSGRGQI